MTQTLIDTEDAAARWCARVLSGDMTDTEKAELDAWLGCSPTHREAFEEFMEISDMAADAGAEMAARTLEADLRNEAEKGLSRRTWLVAAPALAASVAGAALFFNVATQTPISPQKFATVRGEVREVVLEDGSKVALNTQSQIEVRYSDGERFVELKSGEAIFDVVRDTDRPFVVATGGVEARVLGTRFNVDATSRDRSVSVLSGIVQVAASAVQNAGIENSVTLIAGQRADVTAEAGEISVSQFNPDVVTSWQRGYAVFENTPLRDVVAELNRHYSAEIVFGASEIGDIPVTGKFNLTDQATTVSALELALSIRAETDFSGNIVLYRDD